MPAKKCLSLELMWKFCFWFFLLRSHRRFESISRRRLFDIHVRRQAHRFAVVGQLRFSHETDGFVSDEDGN
jgi:hypothetical protein